MALSKEKKIPDINEHQICHTNEQDFCCLVRRGSNHDLFFRQNPNFNNEGGEKCHVKCSALGKQLGKKKSEPLGFSSFYFIFFSACSVFDPGYTSFLFIAKRVGVCISYLSCSPAPCAQEQQHRISSALQFLQAI